MNTGVHFFAYVPWVFGIYAVRTLLMISFIFNYTIFIANFKRKNLIFKQYKKSPLGLGPICSMIYILIAFTYMGLLIGEVGNYYLWKL